MPLEQFEHKHNLFAKTMRKSDPTIVLIASGAMPDTMTGSKEALKLGTDLVPKIMSPAVRPATCSRIASTTST